MQARAEREAMRQRKPWMEWVVAIVLALATPTLARASEGGRNVAMSSSPGDRVPASPPSAAAPAQATRGYAEREARAPQTADFRGGDGFGIYIGSGAALVIVVLLVILLVR